MGEQFPSRSEGFNATQSFFHCGVNPSGAFPRQSAFDIPSSRQSRRDQALFALLGATQHIFQSQYLLGWGSGNAIGFHERMFHYTRGCQKQKERYPLFG